MLNAGKRNLLGVKLAVVDYEAVVNLVIQAARRRQGMAVSALAVHGVMLGALDAEHRYRLNHFDLVVPDGQPVRWALNRLHGASLRDRVYGPELTRAVCARAAAEGLPVFFYGSTPAVLEALRERLRRNFPSLPIAGMEPSKFRKLAPGEKAELADRIARSGAGLVFVGLGCPRQEVWAYEYRAVLSRPILAVGAAFPLLAGQLSQAPRWMQDRGLEWLYRLGKEPRRLWGRYLLLNPAYVFLVLVQGLKLAHFSDRGREPTTELLFG